MVEDRLGELVLCQDGGSKPGQTIEPKKQEK